MLRSGPDVLHQGKAQVVKDLRGYFVSIFTFLLLFAIFVG